LAPSDTKPRYATDNKSPISPHSDTIQGKVIDDYEKSTPEA